MYRKSEGVGLRLCRALWIILFLPICFGLHSFAQNNDAGEIRGTVASADGGVLVGARVTLTNTQTGVTITVKTDGSGVYDVPSLVPGQYQARVVSENFQAFVQQGIVLRAAPITVNAVLQVGQVSQQVTVTEHANELQTENATQTATLEAETVTGVPNVGAYWYNLLALVPGVNGGGNQRTNGQDSVGVNGIEANQQSILLNGGTAILIGSQNASGGIGPDDFISEMQFNTSNVTAEAGNGTSVFNIITKSGTNRFHGSAYDYNQSSSLNARNYFSANVPSSHSNQYGGTIGGPILRNRLFFFFGYQHLGSTAGSQGFATVPTDVERGGDFSSLGTSIYDPSTTHLVNGQYVRDPFPDNKIPTNRISTQANNIQGYLPHPNLPGTANNYSYSQQVFDKTDWFNAKVDYNISVSNHLNGSLMNDQLNYPNPSFTNPIGVFTEFGKDQIYQISDTWTISPRAVNEARFSMVRFTGNWISGDLNKGYPDKLGIPNPVSNVFPDININGAISTGFGHQLDAVLAETTFAPSDVLTLVRGKHILKMGGEWDKYQININFGGESDGNFNFTGIATRNPADGTSAGVGYADFLLGDVANWSIAISPETGGRLSSVHTFFQDDYKAMPNLTFNLGIRYQIQPGWTEANNKLGDFDPTLLNPATETLGALWFAGRNGRTALQATQHGLVMPRFGFAWSPKDRWSIRGAFGTFYELYGYNTYGGPQGLGYTAQNSQSSSDNRTPVFNLAQGPPLPVYPTDATRTPDLLNGQSISYIPYHTPSAYAEQWQLDVQHELPRALLVDVAYVGSRTVHETLAGDYNQVPQNLIYHAAQGADMQQYRPYPQFQSIGTTFAGGYANYNSLQARVQRRYANGFQFLTNFTYSHTLDNGTGSGYGGPGARSSLWQNTYDPADTYGNSLLDMRYVLNGDVIYDLPIGKGKHFLNHSGLLDEVIGGWQASTLFQIHSGIPFTPYIGTTNLDGSLAGTWFPNRVAKGTLPNPTIQQWFDTSAFVTPAIGTYGNSGRNILYGPAWRTVDLSLGKHFAIPWLGEASNFALRIDATDVFNHPNFGNPGTALGTGTAGVITSANTSRAVQLSGKFVF
jgi:hypothetical protein